MTFNDQKLILYFYNICYTRGVTTFNRTILETYGTISICVRPLYCCIACHITAVYLPTCHHTSTFFASSWSWQCALQVRNHIHYNDYYLPRSYHHNSQPYGVFALCIYVEPLHIGPSLDDITMKTENGTVHIHTDIYNKRSQEGILRTVNRFITSKAPYMSTTRHLDIPIYS